jgi:hypothetical protein
MRLVSILVKLALQFRDGQPSLTHENICSNIPTTITSALAHFKLDGRVMIYAVCPACNCTFKPQITSGNSSPVYPDRCTNQPGPEPEQCGEPLLDEVGRPVKTFAYHSFHDYLAAMLSRPDIERIMDERCDMNLAASEESVDDDPCGRMSDVFDGCFLKTFKGPASDEPFVNRPDGEGRYMFALNVDYFNPEGMRNRGPHVSCGIISMACLNLPLDLRYKPENMYIAGIIPGPTEPRETELNHYLRPLIDDMEVSWKHGIRLSQTALFPGGRLTRSAILIAVCDFPAARQLAQMSPVTSHFYCSVCDCYHLSTLGRTDYHNWKHTNPKLLRELANQWKNASDRKTREAHFREHGMRWSELWRLEYWDPVRQLVIDCMHCLLEGLVQDLARDVLGLTDVSVLAGTPFIAAYDHSFKKYDAKADHAPLSEAEAKDVDAIHKLLLSPINDAPGTNLEGEWVALQDKLAHRHLYSLKFVCWHELLAYPPPTALSSQITRLDLAKALTEWVS